MSHSLKQTWSFTIKVRTIKIMIMRKIYLIRLRLVKFRVQLMLEVILNGDKKVKMKSLL